MKPLQLEIQPQPDDATCGPTCLHAVYRYYGDDIPLRQVVAEVQPLETGGTLAVNLARHALRRGYDAAIYTYNLTLFDPSWFGPERVDVAARLLEQAKTKADPRLQAATPAYVDFLERGGELHWRDLTPGLVRRYLKQERPILTGLSATYLYECAREVGEEELHYDDVRGAPVGHFVVLHGYDKVRREVLIADPYPDNPSGAPYYHLPVQRVINAILLGVLTHDANLLILAPTAAAARARRPRKAARAARPAPAKPKKNKKKPTS